MSTTKPYQQQALPVTPGKTLAFNDFFRNCIVNATGKSSTYGISAAGTNQATATQLTSVFNEVDTVSSSTGVNLPNSSGLINTPYQLCVIYNNGANTLTVYPYQGTTDTINGNSSITMNANSAAIFASAQKGVWASIGIAGNENFGAITVTTINGLTITTSTGTLTIANGKTATISNSLTLAGTDSTTMTFPSTSATIARTDAGQTFTGVNTFTNPVLIGPAPVAVGSTATAAGSSGTYLLNTATGSVLTLPAATGTGNKYRVVVTTTVTSNSHKILAASTSDDMQGLVVTQKAGTASWWAALLSSTYHSLQMPASGTTPQGGTQGDWFEITDVATNVWQVNGMTTSGGTVATPFSTADS